MDGLMLFVHDQMFNSYFAMLKNVPDPSHYGCSVVVHI